MPELTDQPESGTVARVRAFNRFYTRVIGVLRASLVDTPFSLVEARLLYEVAHRDGVEGGELRRTLDLDAGYLSRLLSRLDNNGLVSREASPTDARRQIIRLTEAGRAAFADLDRRQADAVRAMLEPLGPAEQTVLTDAMTTIEHTLDRRPYRPGFVVRPPRPGDLGWVISRHGAVYSQEYGWDIRFEALVARIVTEFAERDDRKREAAWIAEVDGRPAGSIFCVTDPDDLTGRTAKLRLLLVEPIARGMGVGERLVDECVRFAGQAGYQRITLWTNSILDAARRIYQRAGFTLEHEEPHDDFGEGLIGQFWSREL